MNNKQKKLLKQIFILGVLFVMVATTILSAVSAFAGTVTEENHPYNTYSYSTHWVDNANGSARPSVTQNINNHSHAHQFVWADDNGNEVVDCETTTTKHLRCKQCGYEFPRGIVSKEALGHKYDDASWVIDKEPTCTETGSKHQVCRICGHGENYTEIPKLEHEYETATLRNNGGLKTEATCTSNAVYYQKCKYCGEVDEEHFNEVPNTKLEHKYDKNHTCIHCGKHVDTIWEQFKKAIFG